MAQQEIRTEDGSALRSSGLDTLGSIPWGTHMCLFYETKADLLATLVPYFTAGLEANECCFWVTSDLLTVEEAAAALRDAIPNLEQCIRNCQMTITEHTAFFLREGRFDRHEVLRKWQIALNDALNKGFVGVRATGDTSWLQKEEWSEFMQCEVDFERMFGNAPVILLCTYNTRKFDASEGQDVVGRHEFALTRTYARRHAARNVSLGNNVQDAPLRATAMGEGLALHEIVANETGMPCDYIFLDVDAGFERMISLRRNAVLGKRISEVFPGLDRKWIESCCRVAQTGRAARFEGHIKQVGRWYDIIAYRTAPGQFATRLRDITERKQAEATLQWRARRNELLADAAALLLKSTHPQSIIEELCCKVMQVLDCQFFFQLPPG